MFRSVLLVTVPVALLSHCAPESPLNPTQEVSAQPVIPVGPETSFLDDPAGSRIDYKDNQGEYTYRLKKTHVYQFASLSRNRKTSDTRAGVWSYQKTGPKTGILTFDLNHVWELRFVSPHRAIAKNQADSRTHTFNFEWQ